MKYKEIINQKFDYKEIFFAITKEQIEKGLDETGIRGRKIYKGGSCLYGTHEGIIAFFNFNKAIIKKIEQECDPQEVYEYEYSNHECNYVGKDTEAILMIISYFGEERAKEVERKKGFVSFDEIMIMHCRNNKLMWDIIPIKNEISGSVN